VITREHTVAHHARLLRHEELLDVSVRDGDRVSVSVSVRVGVRDRVRVRVRVRVGVSVRLGVWG